MQSEFMIDPLEDPKSIQWKQIRIGVFSLTAVTFFIFAILMVSGEGEFWEKKAIFHTQFSNAEGLKTASPVTLGGVIVGRVKEIRYVETPKVYLVELDLEVKESILSKIRKDSIVQIKTQGLLGDRYIEITMGQPLSPEIKPGDYINSSSRSDFDDLVTQSSDFINKLSFLSDEMKLLIHNINEGKGTLGQLAQDKKLYERTAQLISEIEGLVGEIKKNPKKFLNSLYFNKIWSTKMVSRNILIGTVLNDYAPHV